MAKFNKPKKDKFADIFPPFEVVDENGNAQTINLGEVLDEAEATAGFDDFEYDDYEDDWLDDGFYDDPWADDVPVIDQEAAAKEQAIRDLENLARKFPKSEDE
jgi:hypothetical protein